MRLVELSLNDVNRYYSDKEGDLRGTATFKGKFGDVTVRIGNKAAKKIVALCADGIVEAARELASNLTRETLEADLDLPQLEAPMTRDESIF